ncbi:hypothetical protein ACIP4W_36375 [Streptomyces sp. NPDC088846]|uniref:hypothetical protein n=1 Tax=unclassified Streptomyces TaxID=2593676 RepID=UPI003816AF06
MLHDDDHDDTYRTRRRQDHELDYINTYYRLPERLGVRATVGGRIRWTDREGTIVDTAGTYLRVLLNGDTEPVTRHATSNMAYPSPTGWVQATRRPDPYATQLSPAGPGLPERPGA